MTRLSANESRDGYVWRGFDYALQVWVLHGLIQPCAHPLRMRQPVCCNQMRLAGLRITEVPGAERRRCPRCQTFATAACALHANPP